MTRKPPPRPILSEGEAAAWKQVPILIGLPPNAPVTGLLSPDGRYWEVDYTGEKAREAQSLAAFLVQGVREVTLLYREGRILVASRPVYGEVSLPRAWEGITPKEDWRDLSCGDAPRQLNRVVLWTRPGAEVEPVTLWLRWRWCDPWTGGIWRCDTQADPFSFLGAPASPQLLPQGEPVAQVTLSDLFRPRTGPLPGYALANQDAAARALLTAAAGWLYGPGKDPGAWDTPRNESSPEPLT